ncbi:sulfotransferase domain-containing protein [Pseudodesulfovibrio indicus]|uniref:Sulfotransferase domain-containing protein n=1 Tax=Pseudodesulfovibrio indicus TaxID=1716143 RepID=A0A126QLK0_9BACT|nr:sulfotransferase domain-containing protein [Pseudodesulfovibrio indicus]AMK10679.1 hypothetical protein AWY79_05920 [Pseudodesulfovibrio indicus]TDT91657.1 sulfotransferase domain-containing protein [Pseudodesulfovibrio indicus]
MHYIKYQLRHVSELFKRKYEIVSYPKCGRTWVRFMLGNMFNEYFELGLDNDEMLELKKKVHWRNLRIPFIEMHHDGDAYKKHVDEIAFRTKRYTGKRVLFLMRDPRDVVVSQFHQLSKRQGLVDTDLSTFIRSEDGGLPCIVKFYNEWLRGIGVTREHMILRYEDLKGDTQGQLRRLRAFFGVDFIPDRILENAVEASSFARMQKLEKKGAFTNERMRPGDPDDPQTFKVRKGKVGGYKEECSGEDIAWIDDYIAGNLDRAAGYTR